MIEPIHSLAFSMQANRGVYAVLFGSGLSRSARIPTGWEITLDLVRRLAAVSGEECGADPSAWYRDKFDKEPDYSELLDALAKTPAERQQLLRQYWEPTEQEKEEGAKQPTAAHRAIADLVAKGFVRVIVTTNFDRLMELALLDVGVTPTVLSSSDHVHGAMPLIHTQCCVFKVHGDYLDTRIRNTPEELSGYPAEFDTLLDRIFDEFGLIVCGWSADWDEALRRAIFRAPSRRFATYWAVRGEPGDAARQLIEHRGAQVVSITDADSFFSTVHRQVEALEEFARPHPLSTAAAVTALKRYMSEPRYQIQHADLVEGEVERVLSEIGVDKFPAQGGPNPDAAQFNHRVKAYEAAMTTLVAMAVEAGRWADDDHQEVWVRALQKLAAGRAQGGGHTLWLELERLPATLLLFAIGVPALESARYSFVQRLFSATVVREHKENKLTVHLLPPGCLFNNDGAKLLTGKERYYAPLSEWLREQLASLLERRFSSAKAYELAFDRFELMLALAYGVNTKPSEYYGYWVPPGAFGYRHDNRAQIISSLRSLLAKDGDNSPLVTSNLFGITADECGKQLDALEEFVPKLQWWG
ncbi:hypothetical protein DB032_19335 [Chromobacterium sp. Panama]|uniref:SIR2 family protein n=1 Tax=Chromobacterium sp. Panama TaxID=2161826 RepID=UPI000D31F773|nr:SIR2 family protein [Chromobacterium sp. Panama]PTU66926.1 hypothetical protein DB032_19335 [Chromobacterium sp. Panama]